MLVMAKRQYSKNEKQNYRDKGVKNKNVLQPGDIVLLETGKKSYEGRLLETPEDEKDIYLLKLDSGYNIGLNKKNVIKKKVVEKFDAGKKQNPEIKKDSKKPDVAM